MKRFVAIALLLFGSFSLFAQQWEAIIDTPNESLNPTGGAINGFNQIAFSGNKNYNTAMIFCVDKEGIFTECSFGVEGEKTGFLDIKYLDDDTLIVLGYSIDTVLDVHQIRVVTMNKDLEVLSDHKYSVDEECYIHEPHGRLLVDNDEGD